MLTLIASILIAMTVSFLCSLIEAALLSLNPGKLAILRKKLPRVGKICDDFKKDIEKPIAVILILNTTAHTFGAAIAGAQFDHLFGSRYIWLFSLIFTILMVQYTEILPKTLGVRFNMLILSYVSNILKFSVSLLTPLIFLVHFINRPFENHSHKSDKDSDLTLDELSALATLARQTELISPTQEQLLLRIPYLKEKPISELMVPRSQMKFLSKDMTQNDILNIVRTSPHTRYPVVASEKSDEFIGIFEIRQLLFDENVPWQTFIRPVAFIQKEESQLKIAENIAKLDSKILLVCDQKTVIGMVTINNLIMKLFDSPSPNETKSSFIS